MSESTSGETLVKVENVSKKFCRSLKRSLWYGVQDVAGELIGRTGGHDQLRKNEFWAVDNVSFELRRGECLGLIGPNGAGKSTLLKMLNGLVKPDKGRVTMRGRVGALIELGAGFNPLLTSRENIYVNGAVLGISRKEITKKFESIVEFAGLEDFVDTPVQSLSSGMKVRLGFAIAANVNPDVLLIDEVLAVGDAGYIAKCFGRLGELCESSAIILVSHQMPNISRLSDRVLCLSKGSTSYLGRDVGRGMTEYFASIPAARAQNLFAKSDCAIKQVEVTADRSLNPSISEQQFKVHVHCLIHQRYEEFCINLMISNESQQLICSSSFYVDQIFRARGTTQHIVVELENLNLTAGTYTVDISITDARNIVVLAKGSNLCRFNVQSQYMGYAPLQVTGKWFELE